MDFLKGHTPSVNKDKKDQVCWTNIQNFCGSENQFFK